jgi:hypothetical protein
MGHSYDDSSAIKCTTDSNNITLSRMQWIQQRLLHIEHSLTLSIALPPPQEKKH